MITSEQHKKLEEEAREQVAALKSVGDLPGDGCHPDDKCADGPCDNEVCRMQWWLEKRE